MLFVRGMVTSVQSVSTNANEFRRFSCPYLSAGSVINLRSNPVHKIVSGPLLSGRYHSSHELIYIRKKRKDGSRVGEGEETEMRGCAIAFAQDRGNQV